MLQKLHLSGSKQIAYKKDERTNHCNQEEHPKRSTFYQKDGNELLMKFDKEKYIYIYIICGYIHSEFID